MATESPFDGPGMFYVGGVDRKVEDKYQRPGADSHYPEHVCRDGERDWGPAEDCLNCQPPD
jgi:hypothetical protein